MVEQIHHAKRKKRKKENMDQVKEHKDPLTFCDKKQMDPKIMNLFKRYPPHRVSNCKIKNILTL